MSGKAARATAARLVDWIDPSRTALMIIDMQVDFASPAGAVGLAGADLSSVPAALAAASRLQVAARMAAATVVFVGLKTQPQTDSAAWAERIRRRGGAPEEELALCRAGTAGEEFFGPRPVAGDLVFAKRRYSAFFGGALDAMLKDRGVDFLVVCGLTTDCCVDCAVRDAFHLDYHIFLAADACAAYDSHVHDFALASLDRNFAMLVRAEEVAAAWSLGVRNQSMMRK